MAKKLTKPQIEAMAKEIRKWLLDHYLWVDVTIYFNGKAYSTDDRNGHYFYNDPEHLVELENQDPHRFTEYAGDILTMVFEGDLYDLINHPWEFGYTPEYGEKLLEEFRSIFNKRGLYFELGNLWNLSAFYP